MWLILKDNICNLSLLICLHNVWDIVGGEVFFHFLLSSSFLNFVLLAGKFSLCAFLMEQYLKYASVHY